MNAQELINTARLLQDRGAAECEHFLAAKRVVARTERDQDAATRAVSAPQEAV
jgi:hypothetical protein